MILMLENLSMNYSNLFDDPYNIFISSVKILLIDPSKSKSQLLKINTCESIHLA
jgi:hypothetical protein